jgi:hypothetical protein
MYAMHPTSLQIRAGIVVDADTIFAGRVGHGVNRRQFSEEGKADL